MKPTILAIALLASTAAADPDTHDAAVSGFVTYGAGDLAGTVTDLDGAPLRGEKVHIVPDKARELIVTTDAKGNFRAKLPNDGPTYVFVEKKAKVIGQVASAVKEGEYEAIAIRETLPPVVQPKAKIPIDTVLDYSETAEDKNRWTRAWLLVDVTATGSVRRVKLLNAPGLDLDKTAVREAFKLTFEPARDRTNAKVPALVLWTWEWPAFYWQIKYQKAAHRLPELATHMACRGSGANDAMRDCSKPALAKAVSLPWIDKAP